jgi:hypothetical protein
MFHDYLFQRFDLLAQVGWDPERAGNHQHLVGFGKHAIEFCLR